MKGFFEEEQNSFKEKVDEVLKGAGELAEQAWEELSESLDEVKETLDELDRDLAEGIAESIEQAKELIPPIKEFLSDHNRVVSNLIAMFGMHPEIPSVPERILKKIDALIADLDPYSDNQEDILRDVQNLKYLVDELYRPVVRMATDSWKRQSESSLRLLLVAMELSFKKRDRFRRNVLKHSGKKKPRFKKPRRRK
jgi:ElaB/YqjD/DUF883 family membrane-anchored ribosome-binding protein